MAVTFHNATLTAGPVSSTSKVLLHTISAADACLLVWTQSNKAISLSAVNAGGVAMTRLGLVSAGGTSTLELWGLTAAPIATLTISATQVGTTSANFALIAVSYIGQRTVGGSPFGTVAVGTATTVTANLSVSSTSTDLVVFGFGISANTTLVTNNGTLRASATASSLARLVVGDIAGAATVSVSASAGVSSLWGMMGVPLVASSTPTTTIVFDNAAATASTGGVTSGGLVITATSGAVLLVWTNVDQNFTISSVVIGATNLTFLGQAVYGAAPNRVELWGTTAPGSGILTISANVAGVGAPALAIAAATYVGHKTTATPFGGVGTASSTTVNLAVSVSSTVGNKVVVGFANRMFNPVSVSAQAGMTVRTNIQAYPNIMIADTIGGPAITAVAQLAAAADQGGIGINLIQSGPATFVTGRLSATDVTDKFSASGYVVVTGRLSATDAADRFSATGYVIVQGRLSATDVTDKFSATGYVVVSGRLSAREAFTDTFSASGYTIVSGRMSATDVTDRFSASGYVIVSGRMSATDAADIFSASGNVINTANVNGRLSATDAADTFSASGYVLVQGLVAFTDRPDIFSASGTVIAVSTPAAVVTPDITSIGGKKDKKTEYFRADDAFWDARAKYLISLQPAISAEPEPAPTIHAELPNTVPSPVDPSLLIQYRATRAKLVQSLPAASNMRQLKAQGKRLYEVNARIAEQKRLATQQQELLRLAKLAKEARQRKRIQDIRRIKRRVVLLAATRAAVALTYLLDKL